jgi:hypothetical protein
MNICNHILPTARGAGFSLESKDMVLVMQEMNINCILPTARGAGSSMEGKVLALVM